MIYQLAANVPKLIGYYDRVVTIYVRQYGAGNLRLAMNQEDLRNSVNANLPPGAVVDGIPQAAANGVQQYFWSGDLWIISDQNDPVMIIAPAQQFFIDRSQGVRGQPSDVTVALSPDADLSTY